MDGLNFGSLGSSVVGFLKNIDDNSKHIGILDQFEKQTSLPRSYAVVSGFGIYLILVFLNFGGIGQLLSNISGFAIPAYYSLKALKTKSTSDDTKLLTYWVVFAFLNVIEFWTKALLYWIPSYFLFKTLFLLYCALPQYNGADVIYVNIIEPISENYIFPAVAATQELVEKVEEKKED